MMVRGIAGHVIDEPLELGTMQTRQALHRSTSRPTRGSSPPMAGGWRRLPGQSRFSSMS